MNNYGAIIINIEKKYITSDKEKSIIYINNLINKNKYMGEIVYLFKNIYQNKSSRTKQSKGHVDIIISSFILNNQKNNNVEKIYFKNYFSSSPIYITGITNHNLIEFTYCIKCNEIDNNELKKHIQYIS